MFVSLMSLLVNYAFVHSCNYSLACIFRLPGRGENKRRFMQSKRWTQAHNHRVCTCEDEEMQTKFDIDI